MQCREALIEFAQLLLVGSTALESVIDDSPTQAPEVASHVAEVRAIAERLHDIGHEMERVGAEEAN